MSTHEVPATRPANRLLRALSPDAYERLMPKLRSAALRTRQILYKPNQPIDEIYFPENAVICQLTVMENGDTIETATVGLEGASWISAYDGAPSMPCETIVAVGGSARVLAVADLARELAENPHFSNVVMQYSHALLVHSMRLTGCTGLHTLEQRCVRWILTTVDRVRESRFSVTHEFLATLLGCSRPSASLIIAELQKKGALEVDRGKIAVGNRDRLLEASCECYHIIKANYEHIGL